MGFFSISYFFKNLYLLYFYILSHLFSFWNPFPLVSLPHPHFHKTYLQSKTFLNIRAAPSKAVFCSNAVLITTPSSSIQFFSFFDVLPSAPTTTGIALMLLMFHVLLISLFSSWYLSVFFFCFLLTRMSPGIAISIMVWHNFSHLYSLLQYMVSLPFFHCHTRP